MSLDIKLHDGDLPENLNLGPIVACDSEFTGLTPGKDKLCLIQLCSENSKEVHIIQLNRDTFKAPNLVKLFIDPNIKKIFHFSRKDLEMIKYYLKIDVQNVEDSKIQSRIARGYSDQHSYKALVKEFIGVDISKQKQSSDWGKKKLDPEQLKYSATDVIYLHKIHDELNKILIRENRMELYKEALRYIKIRVDLDLALIKDDIWSH